jgi:hypothetical protein
MLLVLSMHGLRGDLEPMVGLVVQFSGVGVPSGLMGV